jgi:hypothetical protein
LLLGSVVNMRNPMSASVEELSKMPGYVSTTYDRNIHYPFATPF